MFHRWCLLQETHTRSGSRHPEIVGRTGRTLTYTLASKASRHSVVPASDNSATVRWWAERDSNPHVFRHQILNLARLPLRHRPIVNQIDILLSKIMRYWSARTESNRRLVGCNHPPYHSATSANAKRAALLSECCPRQRPFGRVTQAALHQETRIQLMRWAW